MNIYEYKSLMVLCFLININRFMSLKIYRLNFFPEIVWIYISALVQFCAVSASQPLVPWPKPLPYFREMALLQKARCMHIFVSAGRRLLQLPSQNSEHFLSAWERYRRSSEEREKENTYTYNVCYNYQTHWLFLVHVQLISYNNHHFN